MAAVFPRCLEARTIGGDRGYSGDVYLGGTIGLSTGFGTRGTILTAHGYCNGNGGFIGLGTGMMADFSDSFIIPVYAKFTYTFNTAKVKPYLGGSLGFCVNDLANVSVYVAPEIGIRLGRFFLNVQYSLYDSPDRISHLGDNVYVRATYGYHAVGLGVGMSF